MNPHDMNRILQDYTRADANHRFRVQQEQQRAEEIQREAIRSGRLHNLAPKPPDHSR